MSRWKTGRAEGRKKTFYHRSSSWTDSGALLVGNIVANLPYAGRRLSQDRVRSRCDSIRINAWLQRAKNTQAQF